MSKERERKIARRMYVELNMTGKEIAEEVAVTEKTISSWVKKYKWKAEKIARNINEKKQLENIHAIISEMAYERMELSANLKKAKKEANSELISQIRKQIASIDDGISKWNKTLTNIDKENKISLKIYLQVMEEIFEALLRYDDKIYSQTLEFQEMHTKHATLNYK